MSATLNTMGWMIAAVAFIAALTLSSLVGVMAAAVISIAIWVLGWLALKALRFIIGNPDDVYFLEQGRTPPSHSSPLSKPDTRL